MKHKSTNAAVLIFILAMAMSGTAAVPQLISYQGLLSDSAGNPANGLFLIQFRIYDGPIGGSILWDNGFRTIQVTDGLFAYSLGDSTAFLSDLFNNPDRWLGIRVGVDPELTPRKQLVSSAFSLQSARADVVSNDSEYVHVVGDEMNGNLNFDIGNDGDIELAMYTSLGRGQFSMLDNGNQRIFLGTQSGGGSIIVQDNTNIFSQLSGDNLFGGGVFHSQGDGTLGAELVAGSGISESHLRLYDNAGTMSVEIKGNSTGDGAAVLPDNSVNSSEILDNSIMAADIGADAVGASELASNSVLGADIIDGTITNVDVAVGALDGTRIADNTLSGTDVTDGTLNSADIANNTLTTDDILDNTLTTSDIAAGGVASSEIADGSIALIDLSSGIVPAVGSVELSSGGSATVALTTTTLDSFTVTVPGTGRLWITVSGQFYVDIDPAASTEITESCLMGLCTSPASSADCGGTWQAAYYSESEDASPNIVNHTEFFTLQRTFAVTAGSDNYYLNGQATSTGYDLKLWGNVVATALFVPGSLTLTTSPAVPNHPNLQQK